MSVTVRLSIKVEGAGRDVIQMYEIPDRRMVLLTYGENIPMGHGDPETKGDPLGALVECEGNVGFFPMMGKNGEGEPTVELKIRAPYEIRYEDVVIRICEIRGNGPAGIRRRRGGKV